MSFAWSTNNCTKDLKSALTKSTEIPNCFNVFVKKKEVLGSKHHTLSTALMKTPKHTLPLLRYTTLASLWFCFFAFCLIKSVFFEELTLAINVTRKSCSTFCKLADYAQKFCNVLLFFEVLVENIAWLKYFFTYFAYHHILPGRKVIKWHFKLCRFCCPPDVCVIHAYLHIYASPRIISNDKHSCKQNTGMLIQSLRFSTVRYFMKHPPRYSPRFHSQQVRVVLRYSLLLQTIQFISWLLVS